jgi:hypothetical protein
MLAGAGELHFAAGTCEIVRIDEFRGQMSANSAKRTSALARGQPGVL